MLGPIVLSGAAHVAGLTQAVPPGWMIAAAQVVIGTSLGVRFAGMPKGRILVALRLALMNAVLTIGTAVGFAFAVGPAAQCNVYIVAPSVANHPVALARYAARSL